jgi:hypothetical protein
MTLHISEGNVKAYQHKSRAIKPQLALLINFFEHYYTAFTIVSNSDYLRKSDILVGSIVICHNKYILGYNCTEHCCQFATFALNFVVNLRCLF